jgi:cytochrome c-type biogenesis protein CcmH
MIFWLICALLTAAVTIVTLRPILARAPTPTVTDDPDQRVYKEQLAEVERDIERGLLTGDEAHAARIEISRRILAVQPAKPDETGAGSSLFTGMVFYLASALIVVSSLGLYLSQGSPGYRAQPFAERVKKPAKGAPVQELIARVEARLRETPGDGRGWDVLAPVYLKQNRYRDAIHAFNRAIELLGENRNRLRGLAEAYLAQTSGIVVPEVRAAFSKILAKEPHLIAPRFWLAVGLEQDGDKKAAAKAYRALLEGGGDKGKAALPPALRQLIGERLAAVTGKTPPPRSGTLPETGKAPALPSDVAKDMPLKQRSAMIDQMVAGLAERLNSSGGTVQEWQRLIRAYWVLGRREQAETSLAKARKTFASDAAAKDALDKFAKALGMKAD